jgi:hypothetical protein
MLLEQQHHQQRQMDVRYMRAAISNQYLNQHLDNMMKRNMKQPNVDGGGGGHCRRELGGVYSYSSGDRHIAH